jgi:Mannose-6-phosphate isomerase
MVSVLGLRDAVVIETDDAVLVASRVEAQKVKDIVGHLDANKRTRLAPARLLALGLLRLHRRRRSLSG